jgi:hypothetical protein
MKTKTMSKKAAKRRVARSPTVGELIIERLEQAVGWTCRENVRVTVVQVVYVRVRDVRQRVDLR